MRHGRRGGQWRYSVSSKSPGLPAGGPGFEPRRIPDRELGRARRRSGPAPRAAGSAATTAPPATTRRQARADRADQAQRDRAECQRCGSMPGSACIGTPSATPTPVRNTASGSPVSSQWRPSLSSKAGSATVGRHESAPAVPSCASSRNRNRVGPAAKIAMRRSTGRPAQRPSIATLRVKRQRNSNGNDREERQRLHAPRRRKADAGHVPAPGVRRSPGRGRDDGATRTPCAPSRAQPGGRRRARQFRVNGRDHQATAGGVARSVRRPVPAPGVEVGVWLVEGSTSGHAAEPQAAKAT